MPMPLRAGPRRGGLAPETTLATLFGLVAAAQVEAVALGCAHGAERRDTVTLGLD